MTQVLFNKDFENMTADEIDMWVRLNSHRLVGSAVFTKNKSFISKLICWAECKGKGKDKSEFVPSHTGSIIKYRNDLYIFDMKPARARTRLLLDFLLNTKDTYSLVIRNFLLNTEMFSLNIIDKIGEKYPFLSALRSVGTKRNSKYANHCSEVHLRQLQLQGLYKHLNPEITPDELYRELIK